MINQIMHAVEEQGLNSLLYNIFFYAGTVAVFVFAFLHSKNYKLQFRKSIPFVIIVYLLSFVWMFFLYWVMTGFKQWGGNNIVRIFVWVPVFAYPVCKIMKLDYQTMCDYIAPLFCVQHGVSHFGCIFEGCCHGYPWEPGIYNHQLGVNTFPNQPIEALVAVGIVIYIFMREKKQNFVPDGLNFPLMLMLFGYSRFLLEFARDNEKLFLGISELALWALFAGLVGTAWYATVKERNRRKASAKKKH